MLDTDRPGQTDPQGGHGSGAGRIPVVLIAGDGIGPEVAAAAERVLSQTAPALDWIPAEAGAAPMERGVANGLPRETLEAVENAGLVLKGPLATPVGYGGKSANVTLRKMFELYGNIRPIKALPGVGGPFAGREIDFTVVRENVEDLYAGVEHMQTPDVAQCLKLITRKGSEKIARLAFELARAQGRTLVHAAHKANIMKLSEGLFKRVFEEVAPEYEGIEARDMIVDNCAQQMVLAPEQFQIVVTTNMNGDILSDLAAGLIGGLGLAPSANIGADMAMFEAVHGSAPDIAGQGKANPTALILSGAMMLRHVGLGEAAARVEAAVARVYADGTALTGDVASPGKGVSTSAYTDALLDALGETGGTAAATARPVRAAPDLSDPVPPKERVFDGADVFVEWPEEDLAGLADTLQALLEGTGFGLKMISNRGTMVWPEASARTDTVAHWRCRLRAEAAGAEDRLGAVLTRIGERMRWMHVEKLESHDGAPAYAKAQGEG